MPSPPLAEGAGATDPGATLALEPGVIWVEPFAGTASTWLRLHLGVSSRATVAYMGSKQRFASEILSLIGASPGESADRVILADAGCWGRAWRHLSDPVRAEAVARVLDLWQGADPRELWSRCAAWPVPPGWTGEGADLTYLDIARWLWIQARAVGAVPVWVGEGWRQADRVGGGPIQQTHPGGPQWRQRSGNSETWSGPARERGRGWRKSRPTGEGEIYGRQDGQAANSARPAGLQHPATLAARLRHLHTRRWPPSEVYLSALEIPIPADARGYVVYLDPPYQGCTGYGPTLDRAGVLDLADRWRSAGAVVAISETVGLAAELGWGHEIRLASREVLTLSCPPGRWGEQLSLLEVA